MLKPKPIIKGEIYQPPTLDMSADAVARRERVWIGGDRRRPFARADDRPVLGSTMRAGDGTRFERGGYRDASKLSI